MQGGHHSKAAASTATQDGVAVQPLSFTTLNDVVSELNAKVSKRFSTSASHVLLSQKAAA